MYVEGAARVRYQGKVFLNPRASALRDISVAAVGMSADRDTAVLDPTAATGIRAIRYYLETRSRNITMLDMNRTAISSARKNAAFNRAAIKSIGKSIQEFANSTKTRFDVIDFDPFGSISPGVFDLLKLVRDGTMLFFTATDTAVLCGAHHRACTEIYDAVPMHNELCHEVGLRIMLGYVARLATQFNLGVNVLLSMSHAHYMRAMVRMRYGAKNASDSIKRLGYAYYCPGCGFRRVGRSAFPSLLSCGLCGTRLDIAGRLWAGELKDDGFVERLFGEMKRRDLGSEGSKLVESIMTEAATPLYYSVPKLTKRMGIPSVSQISLIDRLRAAGFTATRTHFDPASVKTDANIEDITAEIRLMGR